MNKDRVQGSLEQAKGKAKEVTAGKIQNTAGGIKDAAKETLKETLDD